MSVLYIFKILYNEIINVNENYLGFVPYLIKTWNKLYPDVDVKIILIAKDIPKEFYQK